MRKCEPPRCRTVRGSVYIVVWRVCGIYLFIYFSKPGQESTAHSVNGKCCGSGRHKHGVVVMVVVVMVVV